MTQLNSTYFEFFLARYGYLFILVHIVMLPICLLGEEKDLPLLAICSIGSISFAVFLFLTDYRRLRKHIKLANVSLDNNRLLINDKLYLFEEVQSVTHLLVGDGVNDKHAFNIIEIRLNNSTAHYFLDKPMGWKLKSPTIIRLRQFPELVPKIKEDRDVYTGLSSLK